MLSKRLIIFVCAGFFLVGCAPNKNSADNFNRLLSCGMELKDIIRTAEELNASSIDLENNSTLQILFGYEEFILDFNRDSQLIAVNRFIYDYFLFLDADYFSSNVAFKITTCKKTKGSD